MGLVSPSKRFLLLSVFLSSVTACGGSASSTQPASPADSAPPASAPPASGPAASTSTEPTIPPVTTEPVTLEVWDGFSADQTPGSVGAAFAKLDEEFNKLYPNIKVEHKGFPYDTYFTTVRTAMTAREGPDIIAMWGGLVANDYKSGLLPLDDYIATDPDLQENLLLLSSFSGPDGKTLAIPWTAYATIYGYWNEPFQKVGIDPTALKTWDDLLNACDAMSAAGLTTIAAGWKDGYLHNWYQAVFLGELLNPDELDQLQRLQLPYDSQAFRTSRERLLEMQQHQCFDKEAVALTLPEALERFAAKKAGLFLYQGAPSDGSGGLGPAWDGVLRPPPLPESVVAPGVVDAGANQGWSITNWSTLPNEAWAYLDFLAGKRGQEMVSELTGTPPNYLGAEVKPKSPIIGDYFGIVNTKGNLTTTFAIPTSVQAVNERLAAPFIGGSLSIDDLLKQLEEERAKVASKL